MKRTGRLRRGDADIYYEVTGAAAALVMASISGTLDFNQLGDGGIRDWVLPPMAGPLLAALAAKRQALRVPAAGHSVYFERAALFNEALGRFL